MAEISLTGVKSPRPCYYVHRRNIREGPRPAWIIVGRQRSRHVGQGGIVNFAAAALA